MTHSRHIVSIGTTIWSLGELYTGKGRSKYWSGRGVCMKWIQYGNITQSGHRSADTDILIQLDFVHQNNILEIHTTWPLRRVRMDPFSR